MSAPLFIALPKYRNFCHNFPSRRLYFLGFFLVYFVSTRLLELIYECLKLKYIWQFLVCTDLGSFIIVFTFRTSLFYKWNFYGGFVQFLQFKFVSPGHDWWDPQQHLLHALPRGLQCSLTGSFSRRRRRHTDCDDDGDTDAESSFFSSTTCLDFYFSQ